MCRSRARKRGWRRLEEVIEGMRWRRKHGGF